MQAGHAVVGLSVDVHINFLAPARVEPTNAYPLQDGTYAVHRKLFCKGEVDLLIVLQAHHANWLHAGLFLIYN